MNLGTVMGFRYTKGMIHERNHWSVKTKIKNFCSAKDSIKRKKACHRLRENIADNVTIDQRIQRTLKTQQ